MCGAGTNVKLNLSLSESDRIRFELDVCWGHISARMGSKLTFGRLLPTFHRPAGFSLGFGRPWEWHDMGKMKFQAATRSRL